MALGWALGWALDLWADFFAERLLVDLVERAFDPDRDAGLALGLDRVGADRAAEDFDDEDFPLAFFPSVLFALPLAFFGLEIISPVV